MKKREKPKVNKEMLDEMNLNKLCDEEDYIHGAYFADSEVFGLKKERMHFDSCIFRNIVFQECEFEKADFLDVIFDHCDLSNIIMNDSSIHRAQFTQCRMIGSDLSNCTIHNTKFDNIRGRYINYSFSKFKQCEFEKADFESASFNGCTFKHMEFKDCNLNKNEFINTILTETDFSTCSIDDITITIDCLKGLKVSSSQAISLARLLGLIIV